MPDSELCILGGSSAMPAGTGQPLLPYQSPPTPQGMIDKEAAATADRLYPHGWLGYPLYCGVSNLSPESLACDMSFLYLLARLQSKFMLRGSKLYWKVNRNENSPGTVTIDRQVFMVRFSATHAEHIVENMADPAHRIGFLEIARLLKMSIILPALPNTKKRVALGRHRNKIYETYIYIERGRIDVVTSFACNKPHRRPGTLSTTIQTL